VKVLYFDCFSGAAGDMIVGALLDAGAPERVVRDALEGLDLPGWNAEVHEVRKSGLRATKFDVNVEVHQAPHRGMHEITELLERATISDPIRQRALQVFESLARAEGRAHGVDPSEVHFHEVGAIDAIVDVVAACAALEHLAPELVVTSPIAVGSGTVQTEHGVIPVPGPAVVELLAGADLTTGGEGELTTPTGAAILATVTDRFAQMPGMKLHASGYGAGARERSTPNVLRILIGESIALDPEDGSLLIETNIDDMSPELMPYAIERLLSDGAADAWITPILMKKGRAAVTLSVLVERARADQVLETLYNETTTLGVRIRPVQKDEMDRDWVTVEVHGHPVRVKVGRRNGRTVTASPEYEDARKVAQIVGVPLKDVYAEALRALGDVEATGD
jgi:uncharacterized protein (TIGR00299 family) protein